MESKAKQGTKAIEIKINFYGEGHRN